MKIRKVLAAIAFSLLLAPCTSAIAGGPNDFFGGAVPGAASDAADKAAAGGGGDYTEDEKRMQKKFKGNMQHARDLIKKAEQMIAAGTKAHDDKLIKKGKILKEIGEKNVSSLEENNPFGHKDLQDKSASKSASAGSP